MLRFIDGLPHELRYFVRAGSPSTLQSALTAARKGEAFGYRASATQSCLNIPGAAAAAPTMTELATKVNELTEMVKELTHKQTLPHQQPQYMPTRPQRFADYNNQQHQFRGCNKCKSSGHTAQQCYKQPEARPRPDLQCYNCGQFGHGSKCCTKN